MEAAGTDVDARMVLMMMKEVMKKKMKSFLRMCLIEEMTDVLPRIMQFYISTIYFSAI